MFLAIVELIPDTYDKSDGVAVLTSTPTELTASSTTPVKLSDNFFWFTSCWYCPTPIAFGSILTSSESGSCNLLPIDIALLSSTCKSGNSEIANLLAEYTLAPASFTIMYSTFLLQSLIKQLMYLLPSDNSFPE